MTILVANVQCEVRLLYLIQYTMQIQTNNACVYRWETIMFELFTILKLIFGVRRKKLCVCMCVYSTMRGALLYIMYYTMQIRTNNACVYACMYIAQCEVRYYI